MRRARRVIAILLVMTMLLPMVFAAEPTENKPAKSDLPQVYISITDENITGAELTKEMGYVSASIEFYDPTEQYTDILDEDSEIKIRGNSTSEGAKKPYNIKLSGKKDLLGMGAGKKWCLLANMFDKSLMRNELVFDFARALGMNYVPDCRMADVWVDGAYVGTYLLTEPVEANPTRVDIDTENGDYLFEFERERTDEGSVYIKTKRYGMRFVMEDPEEPTAEQSADVLAQLAKAEDAIASNDYNTMAKVMDMQSFIDLYIIEEYFKNVDCNMSSVKFYLKDGILHAGPVWDYDLSSGNCSSSYYSSYDNRGKSYENFYANNSIWFKYLLKNETFMNQVKARYLELQPQIINLYEDNALGKNQIDLVLDANAESFDANWSVWKVSSADSILERKPDSTFAQNVEFLRSWLRSRNSWMLKTYGLESEVEPETPTNFMLDDFEAYTSDAALQGVYTRNGNGGANSAVVVDSGNEANPGKAMQFTYTLDRAGYSGAYRAVNRDLTGLKAIGLWFRGDGKGQDILFQLSDGASYEAHLNEMEGFDAASSDWQYLRIPVSQFTAKSGSGTIDLKNVSTFAMYINAVDGAQFTDSVLMLDDVEMIFNDTPQPPVLTFDSVKLRVTGGEELLSILKKNVSITNGGELVQAEYTADDSGILEPAAGTASAGAFKKEGVAALTITKVQVKAGETTYTLDVSQPITITVMDVPFADDSRELLTVEDYSTYEDDAALRSAYVANANGDTNSVAMIDSPFAAKEKAMQFTYNLAKSGYSGVVRSISQDWEDAETLNLWFQGDGKGQDILLQLGDGDLYSGTDYTFECHLNDLPGFDKTSTEPQYLEIPLSAFAVKSGSRTLDMSNIQSFAMYVNAASGKIAEDSTLTLGTVRAVVPKKVYKTVVEDYTTYADDAALRSAYAANANGDANSVALIDSPFAEGQKAMQFTYNLAKSGYSGAARSIDQNWEHGETMNFWFQGDGKGQDILLQVGDGDLYSGTDYTFECHLNDLPDFDGTSTEPQYLEIPLSAFAVKSGSRTLDLSNIQSFALYVNAASGKIAEDSTLILGVVDVILSEKPSTPDTPVVSEDANIDNFEGYADASALAQTYVRDTTGGQNTVSLVKSPFAQGGQKALSMNYNTSGPGYTGAVKAINEDWSGAQSIKLDYKGNGSSGQSILLRIESGEAGNWVQVDLLDLRGFDPYSADIQEVTFKVDEFQPLTPEAVLDPSNILSFGIYVKQLGGDSRNGTLVFDNLSWSEEPPKEEAPCYQVVLTDTEWYASGSDTLMSVLREHAAILPLEENLPADGKVPYLLQVKYSTNSDILKNSGSFSSKGVFRAEGNLNVLIEEVTVYADGRQYYAAVNQSVTIHVSDLQAPVDVLDYLEQMKGQGTLSAMHNKEPNAKPRTSTDHIMETSGTTPAIWSGDFLFLKEDVANRQRMIDEAIHQWNDGALINIMFHVPSPLRTVAQEKEGAQWSSRDAEKNAVQCSLTTQEWESLLTDGGELNANWKLRLDEYAYYLQQLKDAGVVPMVRPFHEMNQHVFWWAGVPENTAALYRLTKDYLVNEKGLDNMIWLWDLQDIDNRKNWGDYNPGDEYWDILAFDVYSGGYSDSYYALAKEYAGDKPMVIGECYKLIQPDQMAKYTDYVFAMPWADDTWNYNSNANIHNFYDNAVNLLDTPTFASRSKAEPAVDPEVLAEAIKAAESAREAAEAARTAADEAMKAAREAAAAAAADKSAAEMAQAAAVDALAKAEAAKDAAESAEAAAEVARKAAEESNDVASAEAVKAATEAASTAVSAAKAAADAAQATASKVEAVKAYASAQAAQAAAEAALQSAHEAAASTASDKAAAEAAKTAAEAAMKAAEDAWEAAVKSDAAAAAQAALAAGASAEAARAQASAQTAQAAAEAAAQAAEAAAASTARNKAAAGAAEVAAEAAAEAAKAAAEAAVQSDTAAAAKAALAAAAAAEAAKGQASAQAAQAAAETAAQAAKEAALAAAQDKTAAEAAKIAAELAYARAEVSLAAADAASSAAVEANAAAAAAAAVAAAEAELAAESAMYAAKAQSAAQMAQTKAETAQTKAVQAANVGKNASEEAVNAQAAAEDAWKAAQDARVAAEMSSKAAEVANLGAASASAQAAADAAKIADALEKVAAAEARVAENLHRSDLLAQATAESEAAAKVAELNAAKYFALTQLSLAAVEADAVGSDAVNAGISAIEAAADNAAIDAALADVLKLLQALPVENCPSRIFIDAPAKDNWAHEGIDYCVANDLMNGVSETMFDPQGDVTRAQLVTILYRVAEKPMVSATGTFTDVPAGLWYSDAIEWAAANNIVNGVGENKFNPDGKITREQIAVILYRYSGSPAVDDALKEFPDAEAVSSYAIDAMSWAVKEGLIKGVASGDAVELAPKATATRAQIASIIMRFIEK